MCNFFSLDSDGNGKYYYRLKQIDNNAGYKISNVVEVSVNFIHQVYSLENNFPNPFNPTTLMNYQLPFSSYVSLKVFDILGRQIELRLAGYLAN